MSLDAIAFPEPPADSVNPWQNRIVGVGYLAVEEALANPHNWRIHPKVQQDALKGLLEEVGWIGTITVNLTTGRMVDGHLRVQMADTAGATHLPAQYVRISEEDELKALLAYDPITELAARDHAKVIELAGMVEFSSAALEAMATQMRERAEEALGALGANAERLDNKQQGGVVNRRALPLDAIFTFAEIDAVACFTAVSSGLKIGTQSSKAALRYASEKRSRWDWKFPVVFVDNEYKNYDHALHLECVTAYKPKYATTRDIMTRDQCERDGIDYYPLDRILAWAEELEAHAENVLLIPKYDCLRELPERYMIGYSVPSTYGGTPIPIERFRGRRIHLLGGSWKDQLGYLRLMGDDIASLDTNVVAKIASFGSFVCADGRVASLADYPDWALNNPRTVCFALSFGNIGRALHEMTGSTESAGEGLDTETVADDDAAGQ